MIIREIGIGGFGSLAGERIRLENGINVIYGENESGKSTAAGFIKGMLFGLERLKGRGAKTDEYTRYAPKDSSLGYYGEMTFEAGGKTFRLTRDFSSGGQRDSLVCVSQPELLDPAGGDLSALLGDVSAETFEETLRLSSDSLNMRRKDVTQFRESLIRSLEEEAADEVSGALSVLKEKRKAAETEAAGTEALIREERQKLVHRGEYLNEETKQLKKQLRQLKAAAREKRKTLLPAILLLLGGAAALVLGLVFQGKYMPVLLAAAVCLLAGGIAVISREIAGRRQAELAQEKLRADIGERNRQAEELRARLNTPGPSEKLLAEQRTRLAGIRKAFQLIEELGNEQKRAAAEMLKERTGEIFRRISGDSEATVILDESLEFTLYRYGKTVPAWQCSTGTRNQMDFALRMAAWEALSPAEEMPLILDDAFVSYDDVRLANTLLFLSEEKKQVILFTCQSREEMLLNMLGIPFTGAKWSGAEDRS